MDHLNILQKSQLFKNLKPEVLEELSKYFEVKKLSANENIFFEGDNGSELYIIALGTVRVLKNDPTSGEEKNLAMLATGSYFGEMAIISSEHKRTATLETVEATTLIGLNKDNLKKICDENPEISSEIYKSLAQALATRLNMTNDYLAHYKTLIDQKDH
jgi:CRP-like cAMP-binding protein